MSDNNSVLQDILQSSELQEVELEDDDKGKFSKQQMTIFIFQLVPVGFYIAINFSNCHFNCSNTLDICTVYPWIVSVLE